MPVKQGLLLSDIKKNSDGFLCQHSLVANSVISVILPLKAIL
jgi:hypothetical protein